MKLSWKNGAPFSEEFNDVYFSEENGLEETRYVFLESNELYNRWDDFDGKFTIIETGFGTGLNFFASWQLWEKLATTNAKLNFISIEKHPLSASDIKQAISNYPDLKDYAEELCTLLHPKIRGKSKNITGRRQNRLTNIF